MIHNKFINPKSIAVVGASNNMQSPGGTVLKNLITTNFRGELFAINPKETEIQGIKCYSNVAEIPNVDLAIIAIAAKYCLETVKILLKEKNTRGFIIFSAGFSEKDEAGALLEKGIVAEINKYGATLLGPNNIGLINQNYAGVFTLPIPKLSKNGVDLISGSGATAVFIIEMAMQQGLAFNSVYSVGNSAQIGVEDVLEYLDKSFVEDESSKIKMLYIESVNKPQKLLKHAKSLINKGCKIVAVKAGSSEAGSVAASSHTGAIANNDLAVDALFEKAGIVRCFGRNELVNIASVMLFDKPKGKNIAIVTHAGGPAVMLTDVLSKNGINIPNLESKELLAELYNGSTVNNPIDFLATGTAKQLDVILDYCENKFEEIDAIIVIFGSPGLGEVYDVYDVLDKRIKNSKKPIFPIMPSVVNVKNEMKDFIAKGNVVFTDEVLFGKAFVDSLQFSIDSIEPSVFSVESSIASIQSFTSGFLEPEIIQKLLSEFDILFAKELYIKSEKGVSIVSSKLEFPVVAKVVGPIHKTDVGGVLLNLKNEKELSSAFKTLMKIKGAEYVLVQEMIEGMELFIGVKKEENFGHLILFGIGGIYLETLKDIQYCLAPASRDEILHKIKALKLYPIMKGSRGNKGIDINAFVDIVLKVSELVNVYPNIKELDLNPLKASSNKVIAVDARVLV